jgi:thiol:disulfide interchange protein DsbD
MRNVVVISALLSCGVAFAAPAAAFKSVKTVAELNQALAAAKAHGKPAMLDFTADWCAPCKRMERSTFADAQVEAALASFVLLRADVTKNTAEDEALLKRFNAQGPPVIAFFDVQGREIKKCRLNGFTQAGEFRRHLAACRKS